MTQKKKTKTAANEEQKLVVSIVLPQTESKSKMRILDVNSDENKMIQKQLVFISFPGIQGFCQKARFKKMKLGARGKPPTIIYRAG